MLFENIDYLKPDGTVAHGFVATEGDSIAYAGPVRPTRFEGERYDGREKLLIPGFVNAHCHVPMTLMRGYGEGLPLDRWLNEKIFPFEDRLDARAVYWASVLGIAEMLRGGVTSFTEMYDFCGEIARAVLDIGVRCNLSRGVVCFDDTPAQELPAYRQTLALYEEFHGAGEGRILVDFCIHGEYTSPPRVVTAIAEAAAARGVRMHIHLSETRKEQEECIGRHGCTPAAYFEKLGLLENPATAAHCVWVTQEDIALLARRGISVAHCPTSNLKLGSGVAPVCEMLRAGVNVALGTDGVSSNNNFDMVKEMRTAVLVQNGTRHDAAALGPGDAVAMACGAGARAQGRRDVGAIEAGKKADLAVVEYSSCNMTPCYDKLVNLVYSAGLQNFVLTMCAGKVLYRDGDYTTIDLARAKAEVNDAVARILAR